VLCPPLLNNAPTETHRKDNDTAVPHFLPETALSENEEAWCLIYVMLMVNYPIH
jgi:hypothetical protein